MRNLKTYKLFESRFLDFKKTLEALKDLCLEFEDNECSVEIWPKDIKLNLISLRSRGTVKSDIPFYVEIDPKNSKIFRRFYKPLPDWFIDTCRTIEDFMSEEGFETLPSIRYGIDWEKFDTIDELADQEGLIYKVRLEFRPTK
jgi:hypothetical protein